MKVLKLSIILLFMQLLFFSSLSAQEGGDTNTDSSGISQGSNSIPESPKDEEIVNDKSSAPAADLTNKKKTESGDDTQNKSAKKTSAAKIVQKTEDIKIKAEEIKAEEIKDDKPVSANIDAGLLLIDEGNFKYRRIPDIKLIDKVPEAAVNNIEVETPIEIEHKKENSYVDILKILLIFIIVGIFILYMSRSSGSAKMNSKSSKSRKVLNSFRK